MSFSPEHLVLDQGIGVLDWSSPSSVVYKGTLYLFWNGSGDDGIWYTSLDSNTGKWNHPTSCRNSNPNIGLAKNSSPCAIVYGNDLYLFYSGSGNDGVWFTVYNGSTWTPIDCVTNHVGGMGLLPYTSPAAAVYNNTLYLFWNGSGDDGAWYTTFNHTSWTAPIQCRSVIPGSMGLAANTSPAVATFQGAIFLAWNGAGDDGAWYSTFTNSGWTPAMSVNKAVGGGVGFLPKTSPSLLVKQEGTSLLLFWTGSGNDGVWFASFYGHSWSRGVRSLVKEMTGGAGQKLLKNTNCAVVEFNLVPFVFWVGLDQSLWTSNGELFDVEQLKSNWLTIQKMWVEGHDFSIISTDTQVNSFLKSTFGTDICLNTSSDPRHMFDSGGAISLSSALGRLLSLICNVIAFAGGWVSIRLVNTPMGEFFMVHLAQW